jgi:hypothetical protein
VEIAAALIGAVIGGLISGCISYALARDAARQASEAALAAERSRDQAATFALMVKLSKIVSSLNFFRNHVEGAYARLPQTAGGHIWTVLLPTAASGDSRANFSADELSILVKMKTFTLFQALATADDQHNSLVLGFEEYSRRWSDMTDHFSAEMTGPVTEQGQLGTTILTDAERRLHAPRMAILNHLASDLRSRVNEQFQDACSTLNALGPIARTYFRDPKFPILEVDPSVWSPPSN